MRESKFKRWISSLPANSAPPQKKKKKKGKSYQGNPNSREKIQSTWAQNKYFNRIHKHNKS